MPTAAQVVHLHRAVRDDNLRLGRKFDSVGNGGDQSATGHDTGMKRRHERLTHRERGGMLNGSVTKSNGLFPPYTNVCRPSMMLGL